MTRSASVTYLTRQFDDFLFARIDEGTDAAPLSVLSMLARLDVDPWEEAAKLARLPRAAAAKRLAELIAATPSVSLACLNPKTLSDRLLDLLPSTLVAGGLPRQDSVVLALKRSPIVAWPIVIAVILAISLLVVSRYTMHAEEPHVTSSGAMLP